MTSSLTARMALPPIGREPAETQKTGYDPRRIERLAAGACDVPQRKQHFGRGQVLAGTPDTFAQPEHDSATNRSVKPIAVLTAPPRAAIAIFRPCLRTQRAKPPLTVAVVHRARQIDSGRPSSVANGSSLLVPPSCRPKTTCPCSGPIFFFSFKDCGSCFLLRALAAEMLSAVET